jgi:hypothetical protein
MVCIGVPGVTGSKLGIDVDAAGTAARSKAAQLGVTNVVYIGVPGDTGSRDRRGCVSIQATLLVCEI